MKHERRIEKQAPPRKGAAKPDSRRKDSPPRELERHLQEAIDLATD